MLCYAGGLWVSVMRPSTPSHVRWHRFFWTAGCLIFCVHVACALFYLEGFHTAAWEHTARRSEELFGVRSGFGIYFNYLFALGWLWDVLVLWFPAWNRWGRVVFPAWRWFMLFMVFNATVVFGSLSMQIVSSGWLIVWCGWWQYQRTKH